MYDRLHLRGTYIVCPCNIWFLYAGHPDVLWGNH